MHRLIYLSVLLAGAVQAEIATTLVDQRQDKAIAMTMAMAAVPEEPKTVGLGAAQYRMHKATAAGVTFNLPDRLDRLSLRLISAWSGNDNAVAAGISYHY